MSEILSDEVVEEIYRKKRKVTGIRCDKCGEIVPAYNGIYSDRNKSLYYSVLTGHHEWGNNSCDSIEYMNICPNCINGFVSDYLNDNKYDSAYIEIERHHVYATDRWED